METVGGGGGVMMVGTGRANGTGKQDGRMGRANGTGEWDGRTGRDGQTTKRTGEGRKNSHLNWSGGRIGTAERIWSNWNGRTNMVKLERSNGQIGTVE
jgi:hypothetical protein